MSVKRSSDEITADPVNSSEREKKMKTVALNKKIAQHARNKELVEAVQEYDYAIENGLANSHTFCGTINAYIRCGDIAGAVKVFSTLRHSKGVKLDVVTCTTIMKGYSSNGDTLHNLEILEGMWLSNPKIVPNIRTINTFLRGCIISGSVIEADYVLHKAIKEYKITPDLSTWEYIVALYCQGLYVDKISPLLGRLQSNNEFEDILSNIKYNYSKTSLILGNFKNTLKLLSSAIELLDAQEIRKIEKMQQVHSHSTDSVSGAPSSISRNDHGDDESSSEGEGDGNEYGENNDTNNNDGRKKAKSVGGGKRPWKEGEAGDSREKSLEIYLEHKQSELRSEINMLQSYVNNRKNEMSLHSNSKIEINMLLNSLSYYIRLMVFPLSTSVTDTATTTPSDMLLLSLIKKFSVDKILLALHKLVYNAPEEPNKKSNGTDTSVLSLCSTNNGNTNNVVTIEREPLRGSATVVNSNKKHKKNYFIDNDLISNQFSCNILTKILPLINHLRSCLLTYFDDNTYINFNNIFRKRYIHQYANNLDMSALQNMKEDIFDVFVNETSQDMKTDDDTKDSSDSLPLKLEICSGAGDWIVQQAVHSKGKANWISLEYRVDRVYQTFTRALLHNADNLAIIGGDAKAIVPNHVSPNSLQAVFVNYPEPPQQNGGVGSQGNHIFGDSLFSDIERVLVPGGIFTILTDNLWYAKLLLRLVANLPHPRTFENNIFDLKDDIYVYEEQTGINLYSGKPGIECGHDVEASSYFDRLWSRGKQPERYFISLTKGVGDPSNSQVYVTKRLQSKRHGTIPIIMSSTTKSNKKIVFNDEEV